MSNVKEVSALAVREAASGGQSREDFGGRQIARQAETATQAQAAAATAAIQAGYIMAMQHPRHMDNVRQRLMWQCKSPAFAEVAKYHKPVGKGVVGPSIRFVEAALRHMGNVKLAAQVVYDDAEKRIIQVTAVDLETNYADEQTIVIQKVIARSWKLAGRQPIAERLNSHGKPLYIYRAQSDDEIADQVSAAVSKAKRQCGLRIIPGELTAECMTIVDQVVKNSAAEDPDAGRRKVLDAFATLNVLPSELEKWLGHDVAQASPAEIEELRAVYNAVSEGEASWADALAHRLAEREEPETPSANMAERIKKRRKKSKRKKVKQTESAQNPQGEPASPAEVEFCEGCGCPIDSGERCAACA